MILTLNPNPELRGVEVPGAKCDCLGDTCGPDKESYRGGG